MKPRRPWPGAVVPSLFHRSIPSLCAQGARPCAFPERLPAARVNAGLRPVLPSLSTALSPAIGDSVARRRRAFIHRLPLHKERPVRRSPRRAWAAAADPRAIHSFIPGLCAQALDPAGFLSDAREPAPALAWRGHPPACPQADPQLTGISRPAGQLLRNQPTGFDPRPPWPEATYPHAAHRTIPAICAQAVETAVFLIRHEKAPGH